MRCSSRISSGVDEDEMTANARLSVASGGVASIMATPSGAKTGGSRSESHNPAELSTGDHSNNFLVTYKMGTVSNSPNDGEMQ